MRSHVCTYCVKSINLLVETVKGSHNLINLTLFKIYWKSQKYERGLDFLRPHLVRVTVKLPHPLERILP